MEGTGTWYDIEIDGSLSQQNNKTPFSRAWHRVYFEFESDWFIAEFRRNDWLDEIDTCEKFLPDNVKGLCYFYYKILIYLRDL